MRVIAGSKRSMRLYTLPGDETRPTTDRIKETLFNIIAADIPGCDFLDLYAGSGQIGIEALSRGAATAAFCDSSHQAISVIGKNLARTGLNAHATVLAFPVLTALHRLKERGMRFDIIFMDPPYQLKEEEKVIRAICDNGLLKEDGYMIIEADGKRDFSFVEQMGCQLLRQKEYKTNQHVFISPFKGEQDE